MMNLGEEFQFERSYRDLRVQTRGFLPLLVLSPPGW